MKFNYEDKNIIFPDLSDFNLQQILDCGQFFRYEEISPQTFLIYTGDRQFKLSQQGDKLFVYNAVEEDAKFLYDFFDLERDYGKIKAFISKDDPVMAKACELGYGIRILKQNVFETLISFIISQNNNIKRIKGIIEKLCMNFGEKKEGPYGYYYAFPTLSRMIGLTPDDLSVINAGFRAKYIVDAVNKIAGGNVKIHNLQNMSYEKAKEELMKINGVGEKVANCVLLFGCNMLSSFPVDVWIRKTIGLLYNNDFDEKKLGPYAGIAQQYLFYYAYKTKLKV